MSARTRSWKWSHTGLVLLYTSTGTAPKDVLECQELEYEAKTAPRMVLVGTGELLPVREMTGPEMYELVSELYPGYAAVHLDPNAGPAVYRYEFKNLRRFKRPIQFRPPKGAVRTFKVPVGLVARALRGVGVDPRTLSTA